MPDLMQESDENKIRIAKELLLEEVHRLQEERSAFEKERDKTMEKLKEQESFFDKKTAGSFIRKSRKRNRFRNWQKKRTCCFSAA